MGERFSLGASATILTLRFDLTGLPVWTPWYNIAPTQEVLTIQRSPDRPEPYFALPCWGLIPIWAEGPAIGSRIINARAETAETKPAFRAAYRKRRCLNPADSFYEWKNEGRHKQPFHIRLQNGRPFGFAGLWEHWEGAGAIAIDACTILTATPNEIVAQLHPRMAGILPAVDHDLWLDPSVQEIERLQPLLRPYPAEETTAYPVSTVVNNPRNDAPSCIEPLHQD